MNPIVKLAASALPGEKKYILFAGAGVSKDAGVPTAWDLMLKTAGMLYAAGHPETDQKIDLERWFTVSDYSKMQYADLIGALYPHYPDQQQFLEGYLNGHDIGEAHAAIAELARRGVIRAIITTNFDHYIERALEAINRDIQVISTEEDLENSEPLIHCKRIRVYKPHGTLGKGALKNTPADLERLSPLMREELIRILSEHGVIVLGYSGCDKGIVDIFKSRETSHYPLFWVDPRYPKGDIEEIFKDDRNIFIPCEGASQFINDFLHLQERIDELAPVIGQGPTISDLKVAFSSGKDPVAPLYLEYLSRIKADIERNYPDFSAHNEYDDAIVKQINASIPITYRFIEAVLLASRYKDKETLKTVYDYFGKLLELYDTPDGFVGSYRDSDFDGNKFLVYEMFVLFIAALIKYDNWSIVGQLLSEDLFVDKTFSGGYRSFDRISAYLSSLDDLRNQRLHPSRRRTSITADLIKERYEGTQLGQLVTHRGFLDADYFLFLKTLCDRDELKLNRVWRPQSCVYLNHVPNYVQKMESRMFLERFTPIIGLSDGDVLVQRIRGRHEAFEKFYPRSWVDNPLDYYNLNKLGTRK
ncbi:SIR2 family protein [Methanoculleus sp. UBA303]|jgi:hypothetical protein|uniref:SIR2 family protein n=1 Tax=Methanoculleus sp. UBA303 TaxID=1915497 RepID=UPI0025EE39CD|nr:SIR2 family protein [Methanoculleus sp. UBA303]